MATITKRNNSYRITVSSGYDNEGKQKRYSNASLLIFQGTDIKTVSKRLGHSQTSTTMNIYTHQIKEADELAAEALELALTSKRA